MPAWLTTLIGIFGCTIGLGAIIRGDYIWATALLIASAPLVVDGLMRMFRK